jgi:hypothetical protein
MRAASHRAVRVDFYRVATVTDVAARVIAAYRELPSDPGRLLERLTRRMGLSVGTSGVSVQVGPRGQQAPMSSDQARGVLLELLDIPARLHDAATG